MIESMPRSIRRPSPLALGVATVVLVVACQAAEPSASIELGGTIPPPSAPTVGPSSAAAPTLAATPASPGVAAVTPTPSAVGSAPSASSTATPSGPPAGSPAATVRPGVIVPPVDVAAVLQGIRGVRSYQVSISVDDAEQYSSVVVMSPTGARQVTFLQGGEPTTVVTVGGDSWVKSGADPGFQPVPAELVTAMLGALDPTAGVATELSTSRRQHGVDLGATRKNGVASRHYRIDPASTAATDQPMAPGASIDLWIADAGYLVALEAVDVGPDQRLSIQVTAVNDPKNVVKRPS
jgi:hypothetical protein